MKKITFRILSILVITILSIAGIALADEFSDTMATFKKSESVHGR